MNMKAMIKIPENLPTSFLLLTPLIRPAILSSAMTVTHRLLKVMIAETMPIGLLRGFPRIITQKWQRIVYLFSVRRTWAIT